MNTSPTTTVRDNPNNRDWQARSLAASRLLFNLTNGTEWEAFWDSLPRQEEMTHQEVALALEAAIAQRRGKS